MRGNIKDRFIARIEADESGCWIWKAATGSGSKTHRYGRFYYQGQPINAHRASWQIFHGPIPEGMYVCHKCDKTLCVNPSHLFLGDNAANLADMAAKGRAFNGQQAKAECPQGHPYSPDNTYFDRNGKRHCKTCRRYNSDRDKVRNREGMRKWRAKRKAVGLKCR